MLALVLWKIFCYLRGIAFIVMFFYVALWKFDCCYARYGSRSL